MLLALVGGGGVDGCHWVHAGSRKLPIGSLVGVAVQCMPLWPFPLAHMQVALLSIGGLLERLQTVMLFNSSFARWGGGAGFRVYRI